MTKLFVPDMSCGHCKASITEALMALPNVGAITVDLAAKEVSTDGSADPAELVAVLGQIGFPAEVRSAE